MSHNAEPNPFLERLAARAAVESRARSLPALDAAFTVEIYNRLHRCQGAPPFAEPIWLECVVTPATADTALLLRRVRHLLASAGDAADPYLASQHSHEEAVSRLARRHPGFSADSYDQTLHFGCFHAR